MNPQEARARSGEIKAIVVKLFEEIDEPMTRSDVMRAINEHISKPTTLGVVSRCLDKLEQGGFLSEYGIKVKKRGKAVNAQTLYYR